MRVLNVALWLGQTVIAAADIVIHEIGREIYRALGPYLPRTRSTAEDAAMFAAKFGQGQGQGLQENGHNVPGVEEFRDAVQEAGAGTVRERCMSHVK